MTEKLFKIIDNDISDGYHTFGELYDHRCLLFLAWMVSDGTLGDWVRWWQHLPDLPKHNEEDDGA